MARQTPEAAGWVRVARDDEHVDVIEQATDTAAERVAELIRLCLQGRHDEAELMLSTVATNDLYAIAGCAVVHAAHAYREGMGALPALLYLAQIKNES